MLRLPGHFVQVKAGQTTSRPSRLAGSSSVVHPRPLVCTRGSISSRREAVASPGRSNVASRGASPVLEGHAAAAQDVGELLLRRWMGVDGEGHLPVYEETAPLRDTDCNVTVCATLVTAGQRKHVLLAVIVTDAAGHNTARRPGSSSFKVADLAQPNLHWGCTPGKGDRWQDPPPGWSTWPDLSNDARHGAWQTPFTEQELPGVGPALTMMLQLPWEGPLRRGGLAFLIKTRSNKWLGNAATFKDFFFPTSTLPEMPLVSAPSRALGANAGGLAGPEKTLDADKLSKEPPPPPKPTLKQQQQQQQRKQENKQQHHHQEHQHHQDGQEPELPNAGRREKEPAKDDTQVCTLSARELRSAAATQLGAWMQQHDDLEVPPGGLEVVQHEFPVQGHPSTPFAVATAVMMKRPNHNNGNGTSAREAVLLVAALADIGVTGTRKPGLVLQWSGAEVPASTRAQPQPVEDLPGGWKTLPDLSWDGGAGFWDTPMSRHLFEGKAQSADPNGMYFAMLRLPLSGVFCTGGLLINMRTARRQWIRSADTDGAFFINTSVHARELGLVQAPSAPDSSSVNGADSAKHKALLAAGLSDVQAAAAANGNGSRNGVLAGLGSPERIAAALSNADAEMQAHIAAQSAATSASGSRQGSSLSSRGVAPEKEVSVAQKDLMKFIRDFELVPVPAEDMLWGLQGAAIHSDGTDVPELGPNHHMVHRLAEAEDKAQRSLMHRYNIAADMVEGLLPDLRSAAASAPESLTWPLPPGYDASHGAAAQGVGAMSGLVAVTVWLRFSSLRLLTWNRNYNVKPREISAALERLGANLVQVYEACPQLSGLVLLALSSAGRGGEGDMGQRIRDEILAIQQRNHCKGGMMEEWHQKLHNNSSPDDLAICQALLDYLASGQNIQVYWDSLAKEGINAERLASYDRPIHSAPPTFNPQQVPQLTEDLIAYRRTLAAVHSGADLSAAIDGVLGYDAGECKGKRVKVEPLAAVATPYLRQLLSALLLLVQSGSSAATGSSAAAGGNGGSKVTAMVEMDRCLKLQSMVVQARHCLAPALRGGNRACQGRLRDVLFLDLALELAGRGALEAGLSSIRSAAPSTMLGGLLALLQQPVASACMSALPGQGGSAALVSAAGQLAMLSQDCPDMDRIAKARNALSLLERLRSGLAALSASASGLLQPTANSLAGALGLPAQGPNGPVPILAEEVVRGSAAAALSLLLTAVEPSLRRSAGVSAWSVVSRLPSIVTGKLSPLMPCLSQLPPGTLNTPTILVLRRLAGEEEVPPGVVGVIVLGDCPDVLSHCAVRARNCKIPVVACPSSEEAQVLHVAGLANRQVTLTIQGDEITIAEVAGGAAADAAAEAAYAQQQNGFQAADAQSAKATLSAAPASAWDGEWVLTLDQFAPGAVGQKAMSTTNLHKAASAAAAGRNRNGSALQLPDWVKLPASVALPHGSFEAVLRAPLNRDMSGRLQDLAQRIAGAAERNPGNPDACAAELEEIRSLVHQLQVPPGLLHGLEQQLNHISAAQTTSAASRNGNGHVAHYDWDRVWSAIKGVWASQWNSRAVAALSKAGLPMQHLRMGVLLQPLLPARYSWVAHTVNPATGSTDEVCVQLVVGLGEVLVGNHPGRALGGIVSRKALMAALRGAGSSGSNGGSDGCVVPLPEEQALMEAVDVVSYPSKDAAIVPEGLQLPSCGSNGGRGSNAQAVFMARSDSNAEDLPGFAGAGLFDSIPSAPTKACLINYTKEPMAFKKSAAAALLWQCALAAVASEEVLLQQEVAAGSNGAGSSAGCGLDVEGCITVDGSMWVVQARPQV